MKADPSKYLVMDVETNGRKASRDDLLSISIYRPDDGSLFDRFLPLEKQSTINPEAAKVNGITIEDLKGKPPLSQEELDDIIQRFEMKERTILIFGGKEFDYRFFKQYMQDHHLVGIDEMTFFDFQTQVISLNKGKYNHPSKDNLCLAFGIEGVSTVHSSKNDCLLEWKLFEKINGRKLLVIENKVFALTPEYIIPASYLDRSEKLRKYASISQRTCFTEKVFELALSFEATQQVVKLENNITGVAIEGLICRMLGCEKVNSRHFLLQNKCKLDYIGSFPSDFTYMNLDVDDNGRVVLLPGECLTARKCIEGRRNVSDLELALSLLQQGGDVQKIASSHQKAIAKLGKIAEECANEEERHSLERLQCKLNLACQIGRADELLESELKPLISVLREIMGDDVLSQEMRIDSNANCLALCDLSSESAVVEIKTADSTQEGKYFANRYANQLYYSSAGRDCYLLRIEWGNLTCLEINKTQTRFILEKVTISDDQFDGNNHLRITSNRKMRIRHAVSDWRFSNPQEQDYRRCSLALWLDPEDVKRVWEKCEPSIVIRDAPNKGKSLRAFTILKDWVARNPQETRLHCQEATRLSLQTVEKWWFAARIVVYGNRKTCELLSNESLRASIKDIADPMAIAKVATRKMIMELEQEIEQCSYEAGVSRFDPDHDTWSSYCAALSRYRLFPNWEQCFDESDMLEERIEAAVKANDFICFCRREIADGIRVLRIPLSKTRFTTSETFRKFDPARSSVILKRCADSRRKGAIEIFVTDRRAALISPRSREAYRSATDLVGSAIERTFIENGAKRTENELVLAGFPDAQLV